MGTNNSAKISEQGRIYSLDENDIIPVSSSGTRASITGDALKTIIKEEAKTVCVSTETTNKFLPATNIISVRFAFDANIPYTNIADGVIRILKEELVGYVFVDGDKLHFRKQTVVTVNGVYLVQSKDETSITLTKLYNDEILNEVFVEENSLAGVWFSSYNGTSLNFDWIKPFNSHRGGIVKVDYEAGSPMQFRDIYTNELMFEVDVNGQLISYGRAGFANGAFISKTAQGQFRFEINTLNGNSYVKLYNADEEVIVHLDSASASKLFGLDVLHERIRNVGQATADYDAVNLYQLSQLLLIDASGFNKNLPQTVTSLQLLANAVDQLVAGSNGIPNPVVYTRAGDNKIITRIETISGGTIETRNKWHSGGTLQDGKLDFAEFKNSVTGDWVRYSNVFVNGYLMESTVTIITAWTI